MSSHRRLEEHKSLGAAKLAVDAPCVNFSPISMTERHP